MRFNSSLPGFADSGVPETFVMDGKRGELPKKVRPYRLDYRPLIDRDLTDRAISFMTRQAADKKPFFVYLPYTATHFPTLPHPDFVGKSGNGSWADLLMQIDSYMGDLLDTIDQLGIAENTIVIFTADNGPEALEFDGTSLTVETSIHGSAGPWRGTLFTGFEGALRVPFVIRWPGKIAAGASSDEVVLAMDLFPTLAKIAGGRVPDDRIIDGVDLSDFLLGKTRKSGREGFTMPRVYNLLSDPQERDNVLFPHTWVPKAALPQLEEHVASLKQEPPIPTGALDPYEPPK